MGNRDNLQFAIYNFLIFNSLSSPLPFYPFQKNQNLPVKQVGLVQITGVLGALDEELSTVREFAVQEVRLVQRDDGVPGSPDDEGRDIDAFELVP